MINIGSKAKSLLTLQAHGFRVPRWKVLPGHSDDINSLVAAVNKSPWSERQLIVRSSPLADDESQKWLPRRLRTIIGVRRSGLQGSILRLRNSVRRKQGLPVIVQELLKADVSGKACSSEMPGGASHKVTIQAVFGLGEGLNLAGLARDEYIVEGSDVSMQVSAKLEQATVMPNGGYCLRAVAPERSTDSTLSQTQALHIAQELLRLRSVMNGDQEVEWSIVAGELYFLQTRPLDRESGSWQTKLFQGGYQGVTTPLSASFAQHAHQSAMASSLRSVGARPSGSQLLGFYQGQVHYRLDGLARSLAELPLWKLSLLNLRKKYGGDWKLGETPRPNWHSRIVVGIRLAWRCFTSRWSNSSLLGFCSRQSNREELDLSSFLRWEQDVLRRWDSAIWNEFFALHSEGLLRRMIRRWLPGEPDSSWAGLFAGHGKGKVASCARDLKQLAHMVEANSALFQLFRDHQPKNVWQRLDQPGFATFKESAERYLSNYGDRCLSELKLETETISQRPELLMSMVWAGVLISANSEAILRRARRKSEFSILSKLSGWKRPIFRLILALARVHLRDRENLLFEKARMHALARKFFLGLGQQLVELERLEQVNDVFYLTREELILECRGEVVADSLLPLVKHRRAEYARQLNGVQLTDGHSITGMACSPGFVEAPVKFANQPDDDLRGKIVVVETVGPQWAYLSGARGILVRRGSVHSALAARQMGIPCVVAEVDAKEIFRDGQLVSMDGSSGRIKPLTVEQGGGEGSPLPPLP